VGRVIFHYMDSIPFRFGCHRKTKSFSLPTSRVKQFTRSRSRYKKTPKRVLICICSELGTKWEP